MATDKVLERQRESLLRKYSEHTTHPRQVRQVKGHLLIPSVTEYQKHPETVIKIFKTNFKNHLDDDIKYLTERVKELKTKASITRANNKISEDKILIEKWNMQDTDAKQDKFIKEFYKPKIEQKNKRLKKEIPEKIKEEIKEYNKISPDKPLKLEYKARPERLLTEVKTNRPIRNQRLSEVKGQGITKEDIARLREERKCKIEKKKAPVRKPAKKDAIKPPVEKKSLEVEPIKLKDFGPKTSELKLEIKEKKPLSPAQKEALEKGREKRKQNLIIKKVGEDLNDYISKIDIKTPLKDEILYFVKVPGKKSQPHVLEAVEGSYRGSTYYLIKHFKKRNDLYHEIKNKTRVFNNKEEFEEEYEKEYNKIFE